MEVLGKFKRNAWILGPYEPVQVLIRARRVDLSPVITTLRERAPELPHPALESAAREHADYLSDLAFRRDLLEPQVLLVTRDTRQDEQGRDRVLRQADEATRAERP